LLNASTTLLANVGFQFSWNHLVNVWFEVKISATLIPNFQRNPNDKKKKENKSKCFDPFAKVLLSQTYFFT